MSVAVCVRCVYVREYTSRAGFMVKSGNQGREPFGHFRVNFIYPGDSVFA